LKNWHFFSKTLRMQVVIEAVTKRQAEKILRVGLGEYITGTFFFQFGERT